MDWYRRFIQRFGFVGLLISLLGIGYLAMVLVMIVVGQANFNLFWTQVGLPPDFATAIRQPWSLLTYWFVNHPLAIWFLLMDMVVLYSFGHILNELIGDRRMQGLVLLAIVVNALATMGLSYILPTMEVTAATRMSGFGAVNATIIAAAITLVPRYNFRIIVFDVPLVFIGLFVLVGSILTHRLIFTMEGSAEIVGAGLGFLSIKYIRNGWDLRDWFSGAANRPAQSPPRQREPVMSGSKPVIRQINPKQQPQNKALPVAMSEAEELDYLLDKINEIGYTGLTHAEKVRLDQLSGK